MDKNTFSNIISRFGKIIIFFIGIVIFFSLYNIFLIDRTLENMKFSLGQTVLAYDVNDLDGLDIILTDAILEEIRPANLNSENMGNLEYAARVVQTGKSYKQIQDLKVALNTVIKDREKQRGFILAVLDRINRIVKEKAIQISRIFYRFIPRVEKKIEVDMDSFNKAKELELKGDLSQASRYYNDFILKFPDYEKISLVKLRVAYIYHRLGEYEKAFSIYREIIRTHPTRKEADIARIALFKLKQVETLKRELDNLVIKSNEIPEEKTEERQDVYYRIGVINSQLYNDEEAKKFFKRAAEVSPDNEKALKSRFNRAWLIKKDYDLDASLSELFSMIEKSPESALARDIRYQIANIYQKQGKYEEAVNLYLELGEAHKGTNFAALCLFQAGASYMYDLNDEKSAKEIFARITKEYKESEYGRYLQPENPIGLFVTYVVPRATRVVTWRGVGLLCISGYSGEIVKFKAVSKEKEFNEAIKKWLKAELPDTVGNIYVDVKNTEFAFNKEIDSVTGDIMMGKFSVSGNAEGQLEITDEGSLGLKITKVFLEKIPIPPVLVNMAISGVILIIKRYFPVTITRLSMDEGIIYIDGFGSKRVLERIKKSGKNLISLDIEIEEIKDAEEKRHIYDLYKEKFPWSRFSPYGEEYDLQGLFLDFYTRMFFYTSFKLLETVKDSKLDQLWGIQTLGRIEIKKDKFKISYKEEKINTDIADIMKKEFPWLIDNRYIFDVKELKFYFKDNDEIDFNIDVSLTYRSVPEDINYDINGKGTFIFEIDKESKVPFIVFRKFNIDGNPFPIEKLNIISQSCLKLLKDGHIPLKLDELTVAKGEIALKGEGARDFIDRIFTDPYLFEVFQIRPTDLWVAGIERMGPYKPHIPTKELQRMIQQRDEGRIIVEE